MKIAVLGTGFGAYHTEIYAGMEEVETIIVWGRNEKKLKELQEKFQGWIRRTHVLITLFWRWDIDTGRQSRVPMWYLIVSEKAGNASGRPGRCSIRSFCRKAGMKAVSKQTTRCTLMERKTVYFANYGYR